MAAHREKDFLKAAINGDLELVKRLASEFGDGQGCEMVVDRRGRNALHVAAAAGKTDVCKFLVEKLKFNVKSKECQGNKEIMCLLLSKGAKVEHDLNITLGSPLECACSHKDKACAKLLLDNGADPNLFFKMPSVPLMSSSPLMSSIAANSYKCMDLLLKAGADPNISVGGRTPLQTAVILGDARMVERLLNAGANANVVDPVWLITPLEMAAKRPDVAEIRNRLKESFELSKAKGREAFEKKDYEDAVNWYIQASSANPSDAANYSNESLCWVKLNRPIHALNAAKLCVELKPDWAKAHYRMGAALMLLNDYSMALEAFSRALLLDPNNPDIKKVYREALDAEYGRGGGSGR